MGDEHVVEHQQVALLPGEARRSRRGSRRAGGRAPRARSASRRRSRCSPAARLVELRRAGRSRIAGARVETWKNVAWLNQTISPVFGWARRPRRTARVRRRSPSFHSTSIPLLRSAPRPAALSVVWNTVCQASPKPSPKLRTYIQPGSRSAPGSRDRAPRPAGVGDRGLAPSRRRLAEEEDLQRPGLWYEFSLCRKIGWLGGIVRRGVDVPASRRAAATSARGTPATRPRSPG